MAEGDSEGVVSPTPHRKVEELNFPDAMREILNGKRITRKSWETNDVYCCLKDTFLMIHKSDGKYYTWTVNDGDMSAIDWITLPDLN